MVCDWCNELFAIDVQEYHQINLDTRGVTIPADRTQLWTGCVETFGPKVAENGKGVGKGSLHNSAKLQPG